MKREDAQTRSENEPSQLVKAMPHQTLPGFIAELTIGPVTPIPVDEDWKSLIERISTEGVIHEVSEETFDYFLDVLPPRYMGRGGFAFAEGTEPFRFFWQRSGKFYCRRLSWDETTEFLRLARGGHHVA